MSKVIKRDNTVQEFDFNKIENAVRAAFKSMDHNYTDEEESINIVLKVIKNSLDIAKTDNPFTVEDIQDIVEKAIMACGHYDVAKEYILYREKHSEIRKFAQGKVAFIEKYKRSDNTANTTIDDNSNVGTKNIGVLNAEIHKEDNVKVNRYMVTQKLKELFPDFNAKQYIKDLEHHIIYKHDESSMSGAIFPYCASISLYPFLMNGLKKLGGLSAAPKNLDSFCGLYINLVFAVSAQFAGACSTPEFITFFDYFCRKEWGDDYYKHPDSVITSDVDLRQMTISKKIHQYFQQVVYSINQPAAARGMQSASIE